MDLENFRIKVRARDKGFYGGQQRYPLFTDELPSGDPRLGAPFMMGADVLKIDESGKVAVDAERRPVLPRWVEPLDPVEPLGKDVECLVITNKKLVEYYQLPFHGKPTPVAKKKAVDPAAVPPAAPPAPPADEKGKGAHGKPTPVAKPGRPSDESKI
jgi:hypothetical protein